MATQARDIALPPAGTIAFGPGSRPHEHRLETALLLPEPLEPVFAFFADAFNLEAITPPWLQFAVLTPRPIEICAGTLIDYRLRLHGIPIRWRTHIALWEPPYRFVDEQVRGPYRLWHHEHRFESVDGGTLCRDIVHYRVPGGWLAERLLVRRWLRQIFAHRQRRLIEQFAGGRKSSAALRSTD